MALKQLKISKQITIRDNQSIEKYLQQLQSFAHLLTIEEEVNYTKAIKRGKAAEEELKALKKEVRVLRYRSKKTGDAALIKRAENKGKELQQKEAKMLELIKEGKEAKKKLTIGNLRFVVSVAKKHQKRGLSTNDLINEGNVGLMKATERFDDSRGLKFISYAVWWIRQNMSHALNEKGKSIRRPLNQVSLQQYIYNVSREMSKKLERHPTAREIAEQLGISEETVLNIRDINLKPLFIDAPFKLGEESTLTDILENKEATLPEEHLMMSSDREELNKLIDKLEPRERRIIREHFGLDHKDGFAKTLKDIGDEMKISRERVRQIREEALNKLRRLAQVSCF